MNQWTAQNVVYGQAFVDTILAAFKAITTGPLVATGKIRLSVDPSFNPQPLSTIAALVAHEANFSGYTTGGYAATLSTPVNSSPNVQGVIASALMDAASASPFVPNNATGWWLDDGTNLIAAEPFPNGQTASFGAPGDFLSLLIILPIQLRTPTS